MNTTSLRQRRVVIVDDSRTIQALLEGAFESRNDFRVVGVASDAQSGAEMITLLRPDIATIDLCMPYIDGRALLEMIRPVRGTCAVTVSDQVAKNVAMIAELKKLGATACLSKRELAESPDSFFKKIDAALDAFEVTRQRQIAMLGTETSGTERLPTPVRSNIVDFGYPVPQDEARRLAILDRMRIANADRERQFDLVTKHLAKVTGFPVCALTFIDNDTQWIKSAEGLEVESTPRAQAFCNYTISQGRTFVVENAAADGRFSANPLVMGPPHIRSYAGHPVVAGDGTCLGALCLIDIRPRVVPTSVRSHLAGMAEIVSEMIEGRARLVAA